MLKLIIEAHVNRLGFHPLPVWVAIYHLLFEFCLFLIVSKLVWIKTKQNKTPKSNVVLYYYIKVLNTTHHTYTLYPTVKVHILFVKSKIANV